MDGKKKVLFFCNSTPWLFGLSIEFMREIINPVWLHFKMSINAPSLLVQDDASSPGDLVVTDNAGGEY